MSNKKEKNSYSLCIDLLLLRRSLEIFGFVIAAFIIIIFLTVRGGEHSHGCGLARRSWLWSLLLFDRRFLFILAATGRKFTNIRSLATCL